MSVPVIIMSVLGAIFVIAVIVFIANSKKSKSDGHSVDISPRKLEDIKIEVRDASSSESEHDIHRDTHPKIETTNSRSPSLSTMAPKEPIEPDAKDEIPELEFDLSLLAKAPEAKQPEVEFDRMAEFGSIFDMEETPSEASAKIELQSETKPKDDFSDFVLGSSASETLDKKAPSKKAPEITPADIFDSINQARESGPSAEEIFAVSTDEKYPSPVISIPVSPVRPAAPSKETEFIHPDVEEEVPVRSEMDEEEEKAHEKAKRIARVIVNDIRNYNPEKLAEGIRGGSIIKTLGLEIERGRQLYIKRVQPEIVKRTNYYRESLIKILADGRSDLLGF